MILGVGTGWPTLQQSSSHKGLESRSQLPLLSWKKEIFPSLSSLGKGKRKKKVSFPNSASSSSVDHISECLQQERKDQVTWAIRQNEQGQWSWLAVKQVVLLSIPSLLHPQREQVLSARGWPSGLRGALLHTQVCGHAAGIF